jgi:hypothetical protein
MKDQQCKLFPRGTRGSVSFPSRLLVWAVAIAAPGVASANVIFSNLGTGHSYDTTSGNPVGNAFDANNYAEAVSFTPMATTNFGSVSLALSCFFVCPDDYTVDLTADGGAQPGAVIESFTLSAAALGPVGNNNPLAVANSILHPLLTAGTAYWITTSSSLDDSITWNFNSTGDMSPEAISTDGGATWFSPSGFSPGALEVDPVPEPAAILLFGCGMLVLAVRKRLGSLAGSR